MKCEEPIDKLRVQIWILYNIIIQTLKILHFLGHRSRSDLLWSRVVRRPSCVRRPLDNLHFRLLLQNRLMDFDETWYGGSTLGPWQVLLFFGQIRPWVDPGRDQNKVRRGGPLFQRTSSSDRKDTTTNRMHSSDLEAFGKKCCYFWFHSEVKCLTRFWRLYGLSHFGVFLMQFL